VTDDNFATIVDAVAEGRVVYRNVRKALLLLLSTGLAEVLVLVSALLLGYPLPFPAVQILWNNVVTEGTITVNLGMEPAEGDEMQQPPIRPSVQLLGDGLLPRMALMSATITLATFGYFAIGLAMASPSSACGRAPSRSSPSASGSTCSTAAPSGAPRSGTRSTATPG
jgi:Ca2+-transporting ATPase